MSSWIPRETILFIADIKLEWSEFHKSPIGQIDRRSVVTEDPYTNEAETLRIYMQHAPEKVTRQFTELNFPDGLYCYCLTTQLLSFYNLVIHS